MNEGNVRQMLREKLGKDCHFCPIENSAGTGIPDVNICYRGCDFWIEIKYREEAPKRKDTVALKGYLRPQQKVWMTLRLDNEAKNIFLFVRIESEFFLYHIKDKTSLEALETMTVGELYEKAVWYGITHSTSQDEWRDCLSVMENMSK